MRGAKATTLTIWVDNVQKSAIDKVASLWGDPTGVDVNVVFHSFGNIRDDLKTVKAENAPDVIVAAHDWTGDLAANGLVVPLFPTKAVKKQFPKYALDAFSYGGTALRRSVRARERRARGEHRAREGAEDVGAAREGRARVQAQGGRTTSPSPCRRAPAGDAYHMYPFFSGPRRLRLRRHEERRAATRSRLGVANKVFLKNAPLIDKWNREGLINSKVDYGTAKNAWLKGQAAFWITGPWEADSLQGER